MARTTLPENPADLQDIIGFENVVLTVRPDEAVGAVEIVVKAGAARASLCLSPASAYRLAGALTLAAGLVGSVR